MGGLVEKVVKITGALGYEREGGVAQGWSDQTEFVPDWNLPGLEDGSVSPQAGERRDGLGAA